MKLFWAKYKVFIIGLLGAIISSVMAIVSPDPKWTDFVMPVLLTVSSFFGKNLRGPWQSIVGIGFAILIGYAKQLLPGGEHLTVMQNIYMIITQIGILYFGFNAPPFKSDTYEHSPVIVEAQKVPPTAQVKEAPLKTQAPPDEALK